MKKWLNVLWIVNALVCWNALQAADVLVSDDFDDGDRMRYDPPRSLAYYCSQSASNLYEANGSLTLDSRGNNRIVMASLTAPGEYITLEDGQTLSLEIDFRLRGGTLEPGRQLRLVWLDSTLEVGDLQFGDYDDFTRVVEDYQHFKGYQAAVSVWTPNSRNPIILMKRMYEGDGLVFKIGQGTSAYEHLGSGGRGSLRPDELNTMQFNLARKGDQLELTAIIAAGRDSGGGVADFYYVATDRYDPYFRFDRFAIGLNAAEGTVDMIEFERLRVFIVE